MKLNAKTTRSLSAATLATLIVLAGGCQPSHQDKLPSEDALFPADGAPRSVNDFTEAQAAAGARWDGMLYGYHFDATGLNSLGRQKLDLMMHEPDAQWPLVVFMVMPQGAQASDREDAVRRYLMDKGLHADQLRFELGYNPDATSAAAPNLERLSRTESDTSAGGSAGSGPSAYPTGEAGGPAAGPGPSAGPAGH
jgi:hypothetical protein